jgi:hypothetical protein
VSVSPVSWKQTSKIYRLYILSVIRLHATRLSELSSPEGLLAVDRETKGLKVFHHRGCLFYRNNDIVPVDIYSSTTGFQVSRVEAHSRSV